jgi:hypothetical protein
MKLFGNEIWGLAKRVLARLAVRQRYMGKKKWADGVDVVRLSGDEWLRLLTGETNITAFVGWCTNCRTGKCFEKTCLHCGAELLLFDDQFWCRAGHKIRLAIQKDRTLLAEVKSDRESLYGTKYVPTFQRRLNGFLNHGSKHHDLHIDHSIRKPITSLQTRLSLCRDWVFRKRKLLTC